MCVLGRAGCALEPILGATDLYRRLESTVAGVAKVKRVVSRSIDGRREAALREGVAKDVLEGSAVGEGIMSVQVMNAAIASGSP